MNNFYWQIKDKCCEHRIALFQFWLHFQGCCLRSLSISSIWTLYLWLFRDLRLHRIALQNLHEVKVLFFLCTSKACLRANLSPQSSQIKPICSLLVCSLSSLEVQKSFSQLLQWYLTDPSVFVDDFLCLSRFCFTVNIVLQLSHANSLELASWTDLCLINSSCLEKFFPQSGQQIFLHLGSCTAFLWRVRLSSLVNSFTQVSQL